MKLCSKVCLRLKKAVLEDVPVSARWLVSSLDYVVRTANISVKWGVRLVPAV